MPGEADLPFLWRLALLLGAGLLASAIVSWVAANWPYATAAQKLWGVQILLAASALLAAWRLWRRPENIGVTGAAANALGLAAVLVGALFALIGQTYQTGADPWQLFAVWAVLILPWVLVLPTVFLLCLGATVLNTALSLFLVRETSLAWVSVIVLMAAVNLALLGLREWVNEHLASDDPWRITPRALMAAVLAWWLTGLISVFPYGMTVGWLGLLGVAALLVVYTRLRPDPAMLSLLGLAACVAICVLLVDALGIDAGLPVIIVALVLAFIFGARHLLVVARAAGARRQDDEEPWFISAFRLVLMSLAALLVLLFVMLVLKLDESAAGVLGGILMVGGLWVVRSQMDRPVGRDLGTVLVAAGYALYLVWLTLASHTFSLGWVAGVAAPAVLIYALAPVFTLRLLSAVFGVGVVVLYVWKGPWVDYWYWEGKADRLLSLPYERLLVLSLAALAVWRWLAGDARRSAHAPLAWALAGLALVAGWWAPAMDWQAALGGSPWVWCLAILLAASPLYPMIGMLRGAGWPLGLSAAGLLLVASIGWLGAPGVAVALTWLLMGRVLQRPALLGLSGVALLTYLAQFYYQLETPLLHKAGVLGATGAWLLFGAFALMAWHRSWHLKAGARQASVSAGRGRWRVPVLALVLLAVLAVANWTIQQRERVLQEGQEVVLELAPVDPRSLMQGDYMVLRYAVATEVEAFLVGPDAQAEVLKAEGQGVLWLAPDAQGVHHLRRIETLAQAQAETAPEGGIKLFFRLRDGQVWIVTDAWFFPEGQADHYQQARYGLFKVDGKGQGLLVDLLDEQRQGLKSRALQHE